MEVDYLDLIIGLPIVLLAISGFRNGLIKEIASLVALILGIYFAVYFSNIVADYLNEFIDIGYRWLFIIAFILTFIVVVIVVTLIGKLLSKIAALAALGILNRLAGMVFGIVKGIVIMSLMIMLFDMIDSRSAILKNNVKEGSLLYKPVEKVAPFILFNLENINFDDPSWDDFKQNLNDKTPDIVDA